MSHKQNLELQGFLGFLPSATASRLWYFFQHVSVSQDFEIGLRKKTVQDLEPPAKAETGSLHSRWVQADVICCLKHIFLGFSWMIYLIMYIYIYVTIYI